jgi:hypothetical protein
VTKLISSTPHLFAETVGGVVRLVGFEPVSQSNGGGSRSGPLSSQRTMPAVNGTYLRAGELGKRFLHATPEDFPKNTGR